ncbi:hypothetical protein [Streptomyces sp. NPDC056549]|uniref:hypothetical protein n=1 Tax=Streptomyces sp. NPDC056549 TaxID=3345864 RepID=UPI0036AD0A9B
MPTTESIARTHGYTGPIKCQDCPATTGLHYGSWHDHTTGESGDFLQCCACGLTAGDPDSVHAPCEPDNETGPQVHVFHSPNGWTLPNYPDPIDCTTNYHRQQDGRPACTTTPVWKVVQDHGMHLTIGVYCDADLPEQHRHLTTT